MPIFEYVCLSCDRTFEKIVSSAAASGVTCPGCASSEVEQQLSSFAVGAPKGKGNFPRSAPSGPCGSCGHPDGPGSCSN